MAQPQKIKHLQNNPYLALRLYPSAKTLGFSFLLTSTPWYNLHAKQWKRPWSLAIGLPLQSQDQTYRHLSLQSFSFLGSWQLKLLTKCNWMLTPTIAILNWIAISDHGHKSGIHFWIQKNKKLIKKKWAQGSVCTTVWNWCITYSWKGIKTKQSVTEGGTCSFCDITKGRLLKLRLYCNYLQNKKGRKMWERKPVVANQNIISEWNLNMRGGWWKGKREGWGAKLKTFTASLDAPSTSTLLLHPPIQRCSLELLHSLLQHLSEETVTVDYPYKRDECIIAEGCNLNSTHLLHTLPMPNLFCAVLCFFFIITIHDSEKRTCLD